MIGGLRGAASHLALAIIVSAVSAVVFAQKPAKAADLGGDCCADLEDRVAELEATTVRKGNKKVSVQIYGKGNWAVETWNDGAETNTYTVNNYMESSRFGLKGSAKITGFWSAGFRFEAETREAASQQLNQFNDDNAQDSFGPFKVRWSHIYLANKTYGEVRLGLTATPKYDVTKDTLEYISTEPGEGGGLSDTIVADFRMNDSFLLREKGFNNAEGLAGAGTSATSHGGRALTWSNIARCFSSGDQFNCSTRRNGAWYGTPTWEGFSGSVGWFEDDDWGAALRYRGSFAPFGGGTGLSKDDPWLLAASVGYEKFRDERLDVAGGGNAGFNRDLDEVAGSVAIKHKPTGLFAMGIFSNSQSDDSNVFGGFNGQGAPNMWAWNVQGGIQRKVSFLSLDKLGETALWGGYSDVHNGFAPGSSGVSGTTPVLCPSSSSCGLQSNGTFGVGALGVSANMILPAKTFPSIPFATQVTGSDVKDWFIALDQDFASAAFHLYAVYQHFDDPTLSLIDVNKNHVPLKLDGFDLGYVGGRMYF
jgi:predicted porin